MDSQAITIFRMEAQRQAAAGHHQAALELLDQIPEAEGMALRARILCQQGRFTEGFKCWQTAVAAHPQDEAIRRGLALAERLARSPAGKLRLHARRWTLGLLAVVLAGAVSVWAFRAPGDLRNRDLAQSLSALKQDMEKENASLRGGLDNLKKQLEAPKKQLDNLEKQLEISDKANRKQLQQSFAHIEKLIRSSQ
jgi:tetratricopeptide (TPR) repeat protein